MRLRHGLRSISLLIACIVACDRRPKPTSDSVADTATAAADRPPPWVTDLGPLLVVPLDSENTGVVLFPESPSAQLVSATPLTLLTAAGNAVRVRASLATTDSLACEQASTIRLRGDTANAWSVGLSTRSATPIPMDSIESLSPTDSARFAVELARLASSVPSASGSRFAGLPFVVLSARRFPVPGGETVVANLVRRVPQEATPLQEQTLIVADRAGAADPYRATYHRRSEGPEESVDHFEALSAVRVGTAIFLLLAIERDSQSVYEILERATTGWRLRWQRTLAC